MGAVMDEPTGSCFIQTAIARFTTRHERWSSRVQPRAFERLELLRGKPVRAVLRGRDRSNAILLPGGREETYSNATRLAPTQLQRRLKPSVDMTSDVKDREQLFLHRPPVFSFVYRKSRSQ